MVKTKEEKEFEKKVYRVIEMISHEDYPYTCWDRRHEYEITDYGRPVRVLEVEKLARVIASIVV